MKILRRKSGTKTAKPKEKKRTNRIEKAIESLFKWKFWQNLKIGQKYGAALFVTIGLFALSTIIIFVLLTRVSSSLDHVRDAGQRAVKITEAEAIFEQKGGIIGNYIIDSNPGHLNHFYKLTAKLNTLKKEFEGSLTSGEKKKLLSEIDKNDEELNKLFKDQIIPGVRLQHVRDYRSGKLRADRLIENTVSKLDKLRSDLKREQEGSVSSAKAELVLTIIVLILSICISAALGIACILIMGRIVSRKLGQIVNVSNEISSGNLTVASVEYTGKDEIADLSRAINAMKEKLQAMIQEIQGVSSYVTNQSRELNGAAEEVKEASQQVASTMQELSGGAEEQAGTAADLVHLMEKYLSKVEEAVQNGNVIHSSSNQVLELTNQGDQLMEASQHQMVKINEIMKQSVERVKGLDTQTKQISKLVQVINEIAGQTNLLALNAAIEAARAGEHGRGFSVVASEVRKLAEQVSFSVSDITKIVDGIKTESNQVVSSLQTGYKEVEEGTEQIEITGMTFKKIYGAVNLMTEKINGISTNLEQISINSANMNSSIENIASVSEQSAAGIEQTSASISQTNHSMESISDHARSLSDLSQQLDEMISKFKL